MLDCHHERPGNACRAFRKVCLERLPYKPVEADRYPIDIPHVFGIDRNDEIGAQSDQFGNELGHKIPGGIDVLGRGYGELLGDATADVDTATEQGRVRHHLSSMTGEPRSSSATAS